jgi:hypothetical protein
MRLGFSYRDVNKVENEITFGAARVSGDIGNVKGDVVTKTDFSICDSEIFKGCEYNEDDKQDADDETGGEYETGDMVKTYDENETGQETY